MIIIFNYVPKNGSKRYTNEGVALQFVKSIFRLKRIHALFAGHYDISPGEFFILSMVGGSMRLDGCGTCPTDNTCLDGEGTCPADSVHSASGEPHMASSGPHMANGGPHMASGEPHIASGGPHMANDGPHMTSNGPHMANGYVFCPDVDEFIGCSDIQNDLCMSKAALSQFLNSLERKGHIHKKTDPADKRKIMLSLTPKGRETFDSTHQRILRILDDIIARFGRDNMDAFLEMFNQFSDISYIIGMELTRSKESAETRSIPRKQG